MLRKLLIIFFISLPILSIGGVTQHNNIRSLSEVEVLSIQQIKNQESQQVGKIHFTKWFFDVYDAELLTKNGEFSWNKLFLLKIHYLRSFSGKSIAKHTVKEIYSQHPQITKPKYQKYREVFNNLIPDVKKGSNLYGYMDNDGYGYLYTGNKLLGKIPSKQLSKYFFEIWLSDNSSDINLSKQLRGLL